VPWALVTVIAMPPRAVGGGGRFAGGAGAAGRGAGGGAGARGGTCANVNELTSSDAMNRAGDFIWRV
jgi:hypothetical protein